MISRIPNYVRARHVAYAVSSARLLISNSTKERRDGVGLGEGTLVFHSRIALILHRLYTSATSSKSDSYTTNKTNSTYKAMLLNKVVVGHGHKLKTDHTTLTAPPAGYHSVRDL